MENPPAQDVDINDSMDSRWEFNERVTNVFEEMLSRSIPQYPVMRETITKVAARIARNHGSGTIIDLGASRGEQIAQLNDELGLAGSGPGYHYVAVEVSAPMVDVLKERFSQESKVSILQEDLRTYFPHVEAGTVLTLSVLTLQFIPIDYRLELVAKVYDSLRPGGAFILVEKVLGDTAPVDKLLKDLYWSHKYRNGYGAEEIERKALSLEGVLVPVTAKWNEDMLRSAGFRNVDCFWRWANFAAWVAIK